MIPLFVDFWIYHASTDWKCAGGKVGLDERFPVLEEANLKSSTISAVKSENFVDSVTL
jgi:hypothetical protein